MSGWTIRSGTEEDIPSLLELWRVAGSVPSVTDTAEDLAGLLAHDARTLLVAEHGGALVGSLIAGWDGWRGSFYRLAVHPSVRRRGLATALVRAGEERLRRRGAVRLTANVAGDEPHATDFWRAIGYDHHEVSVRFVRVIRESEVGSDADLRPAPRRR